VERAFHGRRGRPAKGRGERAAKSVGGERGGGGQEGQKGERATTRVSLREKRNDATDDSDLASNGPQPFFPHPRTEDQSLATFFLGYYTSPHLDETYVLSVETYEILETSELVGNAVLDTYVRT
jgi:hypothetical protein